MYVFGAQICDGYKPHPPIFVAPVMVSIITMPFLKNVITQKRVVGRIYCLDNIIIGFGDLCPVINWHPIRCPPSLHPVSTMTLTRKKHLLMVNA